MTGKTQRCYNAVFSAIIADVGDIDASMIGVDFEKAFFTSVKKHFPDAKLIVRFYI